MRTIKPRIIEHCLCCPDVGFVCRQHDGSEAVAIIEETRFPSESPPWDANDVLPQLQGYGYRVADQDGGSGEEWVTPIEHKEDEFFEALRVELGVEFD